MKRITLLFTTILVSFCAITTHAQKVAIIGYNGTSNDGYSIVALETIPGGTTIYFTDKPYLGGGAFGINEGAWAYTTPAGGLSLGDVVVFTESSTNNMTMICNIGGTDGSGATCGTWGSLNGDVSLASTSAETVYAYADNNNDPSSGVTEIYAALITSGAIGSDGATNPLGDFPNAVIVDNLNSDVNIDYIDFKNSLRSSVGASKASIIAALEGPSSNYNQGIGNTALSRVPFTAPSNPVLTLAGPANSPVIEDNGPNLSYVFTLTPAPSSNVTVNFSVGGTASFPADYTASGGTISGATGTIVITTSGTATLTLNPVEDGVGINGVLEPYETITITPTAGTGYDLGGGGATGTIANDDKLVSCPLVAITGVNHTDPDGFSFVALTDLTPGSFVYFTDATFNNTSLKFTVASNIVLKWTVPTGVQRGDVFVVKETSTNSNAYTLSCTDGTGASCGVFTNIIADFSIPTAGVAFHAYADSDDNPVNGISEIYSVLYTGTSSVSGGNIPAIEDPFTVYSKAVVVDGWSALDGAPNRTEYKPSLRGVTVSQGNFEDLSKWDHGLANADLSTVPFSNIIIKEGSVNPPVTVTVSPASVDEDSGNSLVFTFTLNGPPMGDFDVSFGVSGTATYLTDYTVTTQGGNSSYNATTGVVTIFNVTSGGTITITPVADAALEPGETVILSIVGGANYDAGSPGSATGTINNDDVGPTTCPMVAITGMNHVNPDGFSFVALTNIPAGTEIYFTDKPFNNNTFQFGMNETVVKWTAPSGVNQGDVFFVKETAENVLAITCTGGTCGTIALLASEFALATAGDELYAYLDSDNDPENGVTEIIATLYTAGGNIPASEDPSTIYPSSIVVDGFPTSPPNRTEYNPAGRNVPVVQADLENPANWVYAQANADLSITPFSDIEILLSISCPPDQLSLEGCSPYYVILASSLPYSETAQTISEAEFMADGGTINSGGTITAVSYIDVVSGTFPFTVTRTFTVTDDCPSSTTCEQTFIIDDTMPPNGNTILSPLNFSCPNQVPAPDISLVTGFTDNCTATCEVWINELHYENAGADVGEFVEVAGPAGTDLSSYSIVYYNGANSNTYDSPQVLSGIIDNESTGFGALSFAKTGIQNGNPDGLALVKNGTNVIEFLSYGGVFTANNGPAAGMTSTDIGVTEPSTQAIGESLSRNGTGGKGIDFTFADGPQSPGDLNPLQTMNPVPCGNVVTVTFFGDVNNGGAGSAANPLVITRTYHAQDPAGNVTPVTQIITVIDNTLPVPVCPADITVNNDSGICGANVSFSVPATDNCGTAIVTFSQNPGTIFSGGMTNVTATATDAAGNQGTCSFNVTVNDNEDPDIDCPANITVGNAFGQCGANVSFAATATDNCTAVTIDYSIPSGSFFAVGAATTVTATATDATNHTATCTFTVTVNDTQAPVVNIPVPQQLDTIKVSNDPGLCGATVTFAVSVEDNCPGASLTCTRNSGDFFNLGNSSVFCTATDATGNQGYGGFVIWVNETQPAVAVCKTAPVLNLSSDGTTTLNPALVDDGSYSCGAFSLSVSPNAFDCDDVGVPQTVTLTATDNSTAAFTTCTSTLSITDDDQYCNQPPVALCMNLNANANGNCEAVMSAASFDGGSYDPDNDPLTFSVSPPGPYPVGTTNVTLTVTDSHNAFDQCNATITVTDVTPPTIGTNSGSFINPGSVSIPGNFNSELGCGGDWDPACPNIDLGYDATDLVWQGTFNIPGGGWEYKAAIDDSWDENYGANAQYFGANIGLGLGGNTDVKFYYDPQSHWITDNVNSRIVTAPGSYQSEIGCPGDWQPDCLRSWLQDTDGDGIYVKEVTGIPAGNYEFKVAIDEDWAENYGAGGVGGGANIPFTVPGDGYKVTFSFNTYTNVPEVSVMANEGCPDPIEITTDDGLCTGSTPDFVSLTTAYDNCGIMSLTQSPAAGTPVGVGTNTVTITAKDAAGLMATCVTSVTVYDYTQPVVNCQSATVELNDEGEVTVTINDISAGISDACGIAQSGIWNPDLGCENLGGGNIIVLYAYDNNGNYNQCEATVTVEDNIAPQIDCPGPVSVGTDPGVCGANVSFNVSASDNCADGLTVVCTIGGDGGGQTGNCATNNLNLRITFDNYPEETSWGIMEDMPGGVMVASGGSYGAQPDGSTLNIPLNLLDGDYKFFIKDQFGDGICCTYGNGSYELTSNGQTYFAGGEFDYYEEKTFCVAAPVQGGGDPVEVSSGDFFPVGTTTVTCTATDGSGHMDVCTFDITVTDIQAPWLTTPCPDNIIFCGARNVSWTPPAADDNCGVVSTVNNYNPGDFFDVGTYTVVYTFYDEQGLSVSCTFTITINPVPDVVVSQANLPTWCQGIKVLTANILNPDELTYPLTFAWSDGLGDSPTVIAPANGTYSVVVTDALGCSTEAFTTVNVDISTLLSAYTIISGEGLEMYESDVLGGGVGIEDADECVVSQSSSILTFMKANAAGVTVDGSSFVNNFINADFNVPFPAFLSNPYNAINNVNVPANATMTLSGSNYGYVTVGTGATLIIANPQIFIKNLVTQKNATILFNQPTEMRIRRKMSIGQTNTVNPDGHTSVIYVGDVASIGQGSVVTLSIYAPEGLNVSDSGASLTTYMTGIFISNDQVASDHHVIWNWNLNCSYLPTNGGGNIPFAASLDQDVIETSVTTKEGLNVYPNPTSGILNIDLTDYLDQSIELALFNTLGEIVWSQKIDLVETPVIATDMTNLAQGVYLLRLASNGKQISQQIVLSK